MDITTFPPSWQEKWQASFTKVAPIQEKVFDALATGKDVVGIAPTGSGKTLAYLWPLLLKVKPGAGSQLLILTSSQELAMQVTEVARSWGQLIDLHVQPLIGGANVKRQLDKLKDKPEVLVATPGRLLELMKLKKLKVHLLQMIVLDEVDQLWQPSTSQMMQQVMKQLPRDSQWAFFSATANEVLPEITKFRPTVTVVDVTAEDDTQGEISHYFLRYPQRRKVDALRRLGHLADFQGLIFFNQLPDLGAAEEKLLFHQLPVMSLASDQHKLLRKTALTSFREGKIRELLTTDVAARGLDIEGLDYVINVDPPLTMESYLHRAGRVGRMGRAGVVITLVSDEQMRDIKKVTKAAGVPLAEIYLHSGALTTEQPVLPEKETVYTKKLEIHKKIHTTKAIKNKKQGKRKKNQKDKGKRRS